MIKLDTFINLFIKSEHTDYIAFSTNNETWPDVLRFPVVKVNDLLTYIYKYDDYQSLLDYEVKHLEQKIAFLSYASIVDTITGIKGFSLDNKQGMYLQGVNKDNKNVSVGICPVLEICLDQKSKIRHDITVDDCVDLKKKFVKYLDTADQSESPVLLTIYKMLDRDVELIESYGVTDQKNARAMFRVVLKAIGEDYSEYLETEES